MKSHFRRATRDNRVPQSSRRWRSPNYVLDESQAADSGHGVNFPRERTLSVSSSADDALPMILTIPLPLSSLLGFSGACCAFWQPPSLFCFSSPSSSCYVTRARACCAFSRATYLPADVLTLAYWEGAESRNSINSLRPHGGSLCCRKQSYFATARYSMALRVSPCG